MKTLIINGGTIEDAFALSYIERVKPDCILAADRAAILSNKKETSFRPTEFSLIKISLSIQS